MSHDLSCKDEKSHRAKQKLLLFLQAISLFIITKTFCFHFSRSLDYLENQYLKLIQTNAVPLFPGIHDNFFLLLQPFARSLKDIL